MDFKKKIDMDIGLKYQAMKDKKIDVMVIFTTDGQLAISDVVVLEDDKKMYPSYRAGTVIRSEILSEYPELKPVFEKLNYLRLLLNHYMFLNYIFLQCLYLLLDHKYY